MRILIIGCAESSRKLSAVLRELGFEGDNDFSAAPKQFFEATSFFNEGESKLRKYEPDVLVCDAFVGEVRCQTIADFLRTAYGKAYARVRVVMMPGKTSAVDFLEIEARRCGVSFLDDPGDVEKISTLLSGIEKGGG